MSTMSMIKIPSDKLEFEATIDFPTGNCLLRFWTNLWSTVRTSWNPSWTSDPKPKPCEQSVWYSMHLDTSFQEHTHEHCLLHLFANKKQGVLCTAKFADRRANPHAPGVQSSFVPWYWRILDAPRIYYLKPHDMQLWSININYVFLWI